MKPFLSIDITNDKKNETHNSAELIVGSASPALREALEKAGNSMSKEIMKYIGKSIGITLTKYLCLLVSIALTLYGAVRQVADHDFDLGAAYAAMPGFFWLVGGAWAVTVIVWILLRKKEQTEEDGDLEAADPIASDIESITTAINAELGVPADAPVVDVITCTYKIKDGVCVPKPADADFPPHTIELLSLFRQGDRLCLSTDVDKFAFPLNGLKRIRTVDQKMTVFSFWDKETEIGEGIYRQYDIKEKDSTLIFKPYHILEAEVNGTLWEIAFPCYELPVFEQITNLKAE